MLQTLNRVFVVFLILAVLAGIAISMFVLFFPEAGSELEETKSMDRSPIFVLEVSNISLRLNDSPLLLNYTIYTPPLKESDELYLDIYSEGRYLGSLDCLEDFEFSDESYEGLTALNCTAVIPYEYSESQEYLVYAVIYSDDYEFASGPARVKAFWTEYEDYFQEISVFIFIGVLAVYALLLFPLMLVIAHIASKTKHQEGRYTIFSLLNPFANKKTLVQKFNSFVISPYFWLFEVIGILIILLYMLLTAQIWKSSTAFIAFFLSGMLAFIVPFLWCAAWWYADFREREPLRVLVTFFLWGMLASLMSIGLNSSMGALFELAGIGFLAAFLVAPIVEESYKGSGIAVLGEHREFNSIEDGFLYGFVIGMGFSFIEDWIYLLSVPMGSSVLAWLLLFIMRSIMFSSSHGLYTAITGGVIGFLIEKGFKAPALGLFIGVPIAAVFHAIHNSGEVLTTIFGAAGTCACCLLVPLFDFGGLFLLMMLFLWALLRKKGLSRKDSS